MNRAIVAIDRAQVGEGGRAIVGARRLRTRRPLPIRSTSEGTSEGTAGHRDCRFGAPRVISRSGEDWALYPLIPSRGPHRSPVMCSEGQGSGRRYVRAGESVVAWCGAIVGTPRAAGGRMPLRSCIDRQPTAKARAVAADRPYRRMLRTWSSPRISRTSRTCRLGATTTKRRPRLVRRRWRRRSASAPVESMKVMRRTSS